MSADLLCPRCKRPEYPRKLSGPIGTICMASYAPLDFAQVTDCLALALAIARKERDGANHILDLCLAERDAALARVKVLERCLCFFSSVIKSGEAWTIHCACEFRAAMRGKP